MLSTVNAHHHRSSPPLSGSRRPAFTLTELIVAIAIVSLMFAPLLPSIDAARRNGRRLEVITHLRQLARGVLEFYAARNRLPRDDRELWEYLEHFSDYTTDFKWHDHHICDVRLTYCYEYELDPTDLATFRLCTVPRSPYHDYEFRFCLTRVTGSSEFQIEELEPDPTAVLVWEARRREAAVAGLDAVARLLNASGESQLAGKVIDGTRSWQSVILASLDLNQDGMLDQEEIEQSLAPEPSDSPVIGLARATAREQYGAMSLHVGTYDGISLADLPTSSDLFAARSLGWYIDAHVDHPGVAHSLKTKADRIEELRFRLGEEVAHKPCTGLARAFRSEIKGQELLSISPESASKLGILIDVLCPEPPESDSEDP